MEIPYCLSLHVHTNSQLSRYRLNHHLPFPTNLPTLLQFCLYPLSVWGVSVGVASAMTAESQRHVPASIPSSWRYYWKHTVGSSVPQNRWGRNSWQRQGWIWRSFRSGSRTVGPRRRGMRVIVRPWRRNRSPPQPCCNLLPLLPLLSPRYHQCPPP